MRSIAREYPIATTTKGVCLANFSSPHPFTFDDGTVLPANHSTVRVNRASLQTHEATRPGIKGTVDILLRFDLAEEVFSMLQEIEDDAAVDINIVPFPVLDCLRREVLLDDFPKARVIRMADRVKKIAYHDRFCR